MLRLYYFKGRDRRVSGARAAVHRPVPHTAKGGSKTWRFKPPSNSVSEKPHKSGRQETQREKRTEVHLPSKHTGTQTTDLSELLRLFFPLPVYTLAPRKKLVKLEELETISSAIWVFFSLLSLNFFPPSLTSQRACTQEGKTGESKHPTG